MRIPVVLTLLGTAVAVSPAVLPQEPAAAVVPGVNGAIVFGSGIDGDQEIYRMNTDASDLMQLTANSVADGTPSVSPDGQTIVFTSARDGNDEIYRMAADGTGAVRLTTNAASDRAPSFSPDGQKIVFTSSRDAGAGGEIYVMNADGSNQTRLTTNTAFDDSPSFSPDGQYVLYRHNGDLVRMSPTGTGLTLMTSGPWLDTDPDWGTGNQSCRGRIATVQGTVGDDVLTGTPGADVIVALDGADVVDGRAGADLICGGRGSDTVSYATHEFDVVASLAGLSAGNGSAEDGPPGLRDLINDDVEGLTGGYGDDELTGDEERNVLTGGPGDDLLAGLTEDDRLVGGSGDDTLDGGAQNDVLRGLGGLDVLQGGTGNDNLDGGNDADAYDGGDGTDTATYATRTTPVVVTVGDATGDDGGAVDGPSGYRDTVEAPVERVVGGSGADTLTGSGGANRLTGGPGADALSGLAGADTLVADAGAADLLIDCGTGVDFAALLDPGTDPAPVSCGER
jgi:Ca2+-binding RTX toxin-like protein